MYQAIPVWAFIEEQSAQGMPTLLTATQDRIDRRGMAGYLVTHRKFTPEHALQRLRDAKPTACPPTAMPTHSRC